VIWFDGEQGLPQFTFLGFTFCWRSEWDQTRGLEIVLARRWRLVRIWNRPDSDARRASQACFLCGKDPAAGLASINSARLCHGDDDPEPTCYMRAQWEGVALALCAGCIEGSEPMLGGDGE
jgi:hypothetical protein